jgi:uncharacterized protein (DUF1697 family)
MTVYIAFLRAVNVGGTGKLPMIDLKNMCVALGFKDVQTYIASGNVVFESDEAAAPLKSTLELALFNYAGKPVRVMLRTALQIQHVLNGNPFKNAAGNRVMAVFLNDALNADALLGITNRTNEELALGEREIYIHYKGGMGQSKLHIPAAKLGTARNMNTVARLAEMANER